MTALRRGGFTLLEMMGVIVAIGLVLAIATDYYIDLSRASNRASRNTSEIRRATAILDHVAHDLENTMLIVKAPEVDPLDHPWLFVAEARNSDEGSDHVKFVTRSFQSRRSDAHESDLAIVAYSLELSEEDDAFELFRWSSPQLPESLDRTFPEPDDESSFLLADGIADFGLRFIAEDGGESDEWDSTLLADSGTLPDWVEISVAMYDPDIEDPLGLDAEERTYYRRRVRIPVRPIELAAMIAGEEAARAGANGDDETDGENGEGGSSQNGSGVEFGDEGDPTANFTVGDCLDLAGMTAMIQQSMPSFSGYVKSNLNQPWSSVKAILPPDVRPFVLPKCR